MARGSTLAKALQVPDGIHVEVRAVPPTGDCFYDCLDLLLPPRPTSSSPLRFSPRTNGGFTRPYVRKRSLYSPRHMREYVAGTMTQELFDLYGMYSAAGVDDYAWMHHHHAPTNLDELREYARRVGRDAGAGHCLWADEYAIRTISEEAEVTLLIIDEQATSRRGNRSAFPRRRKRRRRNEDGTTSPPPEEDPMEEQRPDGRFLVIGTYEDCVMLLRSRRQHYDAVVIGGQRMFRVEELPEATRNLWPNLAGAVPTPTPSLTPSDDRNVVEEEEEKKEDGTEKGAKGGRGGEKASSSPRKKKKSV